MKKKINISRDVESRRRIAANIGPEIEVDPVVIKKNPEPQAEPEEETVIHQEPINDASSPEEEQKENADQSGGTAEKPKKRTRPAKTDL